MTDANYILERVYVMLTISQFHGPRTGGIPADQSPGTRSSNVCGSKLGIRSSQERRSVEELAILVGRQRFEEITRHLSISPITMSREPTMAGMSAIRHPSQSFAVTDRLQNEELLARARSGLLLSLPIT